MTANLSLIQNVSTVYQLFDGANKATASSGFPNGILITGFMIAIFIIILMNLKRSDNIVEPLMASTWICFVISSLLAYVALVPILMPLLFLLGAGLSTAYSFMDRP